jgi:hypothetical protein
MLALIIRGNGRAQSTRSNWKRDLTLATALHSINDKAAFDRINKLANGKPWPDTVPNEIQNAPR